ncbi:MAG: hypothetical protein Q9226_003357 [Calogaya cf. arnoldii]
MTNDTNPDVNERGIPDMELFRQIFCHDRVHVYFLGLFDCVKSTGRFDQYLRSQGSPTTIVKHIRHAVAINEYREHLTPTLFERKVDNQDSERLVEMWFVGLMKTSVERTASSTIEEMEEEFVTLGDLPHKVLSWPIASESATNNARKQLAGVCRTFHPSVIVLYRQGLLGNEDTPQSVIAHSEAMDDHRDLVFKEGDTLRIVRTEGGWDLIAQDTQSSEDSTAKPDGEQKAASEQSDEAGSKGDPANQIMRKA